MKKLEFKTNSGDFILKDFPKELVEFTFSESTRLTINGIKYQPCGIVKHMTEEQFAEVVDSELDSHLKPNYKDYLHDHNSGFEDEYTYYTAKQSFESLIKSLGWCLWENPVAVLMHKSNNIHEMSEYIKSESKTLYNPIILKKL